MPSTALLCCMLRHIQTIIDSSLKTSIVHSKYILGTVKYTQRGSTMCLRRFTTNNNEYMHQRFMSLTRSINISEQSDAAPSHVILKQQIHFRFNKTRLHWSQLKMDVDQENQTSLCFKYSFFSQQKPDHGL